MSRSRRSPVLLVAALALTVAVSSCASAQGGASSEDRAVPPPGRVLPGEPAPDGGSDTSGDAGAETADREVVVTAWLSLSDADPLAVADDLQEIVDAVGGRVEQRSDSPAGGGGPASSSLVLRVPANDLDGTIDRIGEAATVVSSAIDRRDVTESVTDVTARIGALEASIDRLLDLLDGAESTADLITIESELTTRQAERDSLVAQQQSLVEQVAFSTVTVEIGVPGVVTEAGPGDFWSGLALGFRSLGAVLSGVLVAVGVALPWFLLAAAVAALVWGARRKGFRRSSRRATPSPSPSSPDRAPAADAASAAPSSSASSSPAPEPPAPASAAPASAPTRVVIPPRPPLPTAVTTPGPVEAAAGAADPPTPPGADEPEPPASATSTPPPKKATARSTTARSAKARSTSARPTTTRAPRPPKDET